MEGPLKFCFKGPLEIQMVGASDPQQKMSTESLKTPKIIPSNQKNSVLYLWKISLNFIIYSLRNHKLTKRRLLHCVKVHRTQGSVPIVTLFWPHRALANQSRFWRFDTFSDHLNLWFIKPKCYKLISTGSGVEWAECLLIIGTGRQRTVELKVFSLILNSSVGLSAGSNPACSRGRQLVSFRFKYRLPVPEHQN